MKFLILCLVAAGAFATPDHVNLKPSPQIVGGTDADEGEFPYQLSMQYYAGSYAGYVQYCGASIYNEDTVITAAHCTYEKPPTKFRIVAGEHNLAEFSGYEQNFDVEEIIEHENYNPKTFENDIALMKLKGKLNFNSRVKPIDLPPRDFIPTGSCTISGWGTLKSGGESPDILQKVDVKIVTEERCERAYGKERIVDSMLCAGEGGKDSCQGDSGGPLKCEGYLAGVVSFGIGCGLSSFPGIYTEVTYYLDWIAENA